jgi:hypothetical protein
MRYLMQRLDLMMPCISPINRPGGKCDFTAQPPICSTMIRVQHARAREASENFFRRAISHAGYVDSFFIDCKKIIQQPGRRKTFVRETQ